jgi:hypothetical protein
MWLHLLLSLLAPQDPATAILGRWEGTSTCVKAEWNRGCHDEIARYDFVPDTAHAGVILVHGYKLVAGEWDFMGEIELRYDSAGHRWAGEWGNGRVHIELSYVLQGTDLVGKLIGLPDGRKARDIIVHRSPPTTH